MWSVVQWSGSSVARAPDINQGDVGSTPAPLSNLSKIADTARIDTLID